MPIDGKGSLWPVNLDTWSLSGYQQLAPIAGVYYLLNLLTGKYYIGSSINLRTRIRKHWRDLQRGKHSNRYLQNSWNLHGEAAFRFGLLEVTPGIERKSLRDVEKLWVARLHTADPTSGYNILSETQQSVAYTTLETRRKLSQACQGRKLSPEHIQKIADSNRGRKVSDETRRRLSESHKGLRYPNRSPHTLEARQKMRKAKLADFVAISPDGEQHLVTDLPVFCEMYNLRYDCMTRVSAGRRPHHKGWIVRRLSDEVDNGN